MKKYLKELHKKLVELKKKIPEERKIKVSPSDTVSESVLKVVEVVNSYEKEKKKSNPWILCP